MTALSPLRALPLVLLVGACSQHTTRLAAEGTGDLSNPAAPRRAPDSVLVASCGDGAEIAPRLDRRPYLQRVGAHDARVLFTAADGAPIAVELRRPDGTLVAAHPATRAAPDEPWSVRFVGLEPGQIYCYALPGITSPAGFRTAPQTGDVSFVAFGDSGNGSSNQRAVYGQIQTVPFDFVLHLGDLAYETGRASELESRFFDVYRPTTRSFAVFPVIGNHDDATDHAAAYLRAFDLPDNGVPAQRERFYSFDWGDVHFVALDTERVTAEQAAFLDHDLTNSKQPWQVVLAHRPAHSSGDHGGLASFRKTFGPVLKKHRVPLVLSGHEHDYERTAAIDGTIYVVSGGGGRDTRPVGWSDFTAYAESVLHFLFVELRGGRLVVHAIDGVGREFDSVAIVRPLP